MGLEAGTVALLGTLASATASGVNMYNQRRALKEQEDQALQGMAGQRAKQREIDARLNQEIDSLEQSTPEDEQNASMQAFLNQLRMNRAGAEGEETPGVSRYGQDTANAQASIDNYGKKVASIMSRIGAAREQRRNEGFSVGRAASDVANTARNASGDDFINRLRMSQIRPNEWATAGGDFLKGAGAGAVSYAGAMPGRMDGLSEVNVTAQPLARQAPPQSLAWRMANPWAGGLEPR